MKYIIVSKGTSDFNRGNGTFDSGTPTYQTESATELIISRLAAINYLKEGKITKNTTVVTLSERKFLYENIFNNVETYDSQKKYDDCLDLITDQTFDELCRTIPYKPFYKNFERDKNEILNIKYNNEILNMQLPDFLVCIPRMKNSDKRRNLDKQYWIDFINVAELKYEKIFIFGKGNEDMETSKSSYINTFQDYCSLIHHPNCVDIVNTISGPCHFAHFFSNTANKTKMTMIDNNNLIEKHGDDPSYFHPCLNFSKIPINFVNYLISPDELLFLIKK